MADYTPGTFILIQNRFRELFVAEVVEVEPELGKDVEVQLYYPTSDAGVDDTQFISMEDVLAVFESKDKARAYITAFELSH